MRHLWTNQHLLKLQTLNLHRKIGDGIIAGPCFRELSDLFSSVSLRKLKFSSGAKGSSAEPTTERQSSGYGSFPKISYKQIRLVNQVQKIRNNMPGLLPERRRRGLIAGGVTVTLEPNTGGDAISTIFLIQIIPTYDLSKTTRLPEVAWSEKIMQCYLSMPYAFYLTTRNSLCRISYSNFSR